MVPDDGMNEVPQNMLTLQEMKFVPLSEGGVPSMSEAGEPLGLFLLKLYVKLRC